MRSPTSASVDKSITAKGTVAGDVRISLSNSTPSPSGKTTSRIATENDSSRSFLRASATVAQESTTRPAAERASVRSILTVKLSSTTNTSAVIAPPLDDHYVQPRREPGQSREGAAHARRHAGEPPRAAFRKRRTWL